MFTQGGFDGASMDQIAAAAGVSKLTVYSHFGDKEALFVAVVKSHCEQQLPSSLFEPMPQVPLRERLLAIAQAFYAMISSPAAVAGHRMLCTPQLADSPLPQLFWEAGPKRVQADFAALLRAAHRRGRTRHPRRAPRGLAVLQPAQGRAAHARWCSVVAARTRWPTSTRTSPRRSTCSCAPTPRRTSGRTRAAPTLSRMVRRDDDGSMTMVSVTYGT